MSKRKRPTQKPQNAPKREKPAKAEQNSESGSRFSRTWIIGGVLVAVLFIAELFAQANSQPHPVTPTPAGSYNVGIIQNCAGFSPFMQKLGFGQNSALDTRSKLVEGVALRQFDTQGNIIKSYQDPTWSRAGFLGSIKVDGQGNIYLIPVPAINILDNPPDKSNIIYRIGADTGIMAPLAPVPTLAPANNQNAYGLLDITYDCETRTLYVSSVYGSSYDRIAGSIFQIDPDTGAVLSKLDYVDAFGLGVFNAVNGKRLYFGLARTPDVYSVALDAKGTITKDVRKEPSLSLFGTTSDERAQTITFQEPNQMIIKSTQFDFNLTAPTEVRQTLSTYKYDTTHDTWQYVNSQIISS